MSVKTHFVSCNVRKVHWGASSGSNTSDLIQILSSSSFLFHGLLCAWKSIWILAVEDLPWQRGHCRAAKQQTSWLIFQMFEFLFHLVLFLIPKVHHITGNMIFFWCVCVSKVLVVCKWCQRLERASSGGGQRVKFFDYNHYHWLRRFRFVGICIHENSFWLLLFTILVGGIPPNIWAYHHCSDFGFLCGVAYFACWCAVYDF